MRVKYVQSLFLLVFIITSFPVEGQSEIGPIRLFNNGNTSLGQSSGIVQVYYSSNGSSEWVNVCSGSTSTQANAGVICHQLGFTGAASYSTSGKENFGTDLSVSLLKNLICDSSDLLVIHQCDYSDVGSKCDDTMDLTVNCSTKRLDSNPFNTMVRLVDGSTVSEGRVEIYCNNEWGTVCDTREIDSSGFANLACKQLGYTNAGTWDEIIRKGSDNQKIWMKDVLCPSTEKFDCIATCKTCPIGSDNNVTSCNHTTDMTIRCVYDKGDGTVVQYELDTCRYINDITVGVTVGVIVAVILSAIFACAVCIVIAVLVPICICCCLGIGVGAKATTKVRKTTNYANFD